jgi:hypothetical protein
MVVLDLWQVAGGRSRHQAPSGNGSAPYSLSILGAAEALANSLNLTCSKAEHTEQGAGAQTPSASSTHCSSTCIDHWPNSSCSGAGHKQTGDALHEDGLVADGMALDPRTLQVSE